jgi:hypothetical protein
LEFKGGNGISKIKWTNSLSNNSEFISFVLKDINKSFKIILNFSISKIFEIKLKLKGIKILVSEILNLLVFIPFISS